MNKKALFIAVHLLFWLFTSWLIVSSFSITEHLVTNNNGIITEDIERSDELIWFFSFGQPFFAIYFYVQLMLTKKLVKLRRVKEMIWKTILLSIVFYGLYLTVVYLFFFEHIHVLEFPSLWYGIFIFYFIIAIAYGFIEAWNNSEKIKSELEISNKEAELNLLRAQLHPHFLFNTLNNLLAMVNQEQNPKLTKSIDTLSNLLRYVVYENLNPKVAIFKEIAFIKDYAELHLLRFEEDEIDFSIKIKGKNNQQKIESSILLSFVENAFKHGLQPEVSSYIHISINLENENQILFQITNSVHVDKVILDIGGYGLKAAKDRLELAYPNAYQLKIMKTANKYQVNLTLNTNESNYS